MYGKMQASELTEFILFICSSALWCQILFPHSTLGVAVGCFLHSLSSSAISVGAGGICWITVLRALIHIWRTEIADGCDISCLLIWQEMFSFHKAKAFSQIRSGNVEGLVPRRILQGFIFTYLYLFLLFGFADTWGLMRASQVALVEKNQTAKCRRPEVWSLAWKDPLEKEMTVYSNILAWQITWTEEPGSVQFMGPQRVGHDWSDLTHTWGLMLSTLLSLLLCLHSNIGNLKENLQPCCLISWRREGGWVSKEVLLSRFSRVQLCATTWTAAYQAPPSMGFSRQEYWSGLPLPSPERGTK